MSLFGALPIATSGIDAMNTWIDTSAGNIANIDDTASTSGQAYQAQTPFLSPTPAAVIGGEGQGVTVGGEVLGPGGLVEHEPSHPLADAQGNVLVPNISLSDQLVGMMQAQDGYQADASVIKEAKTAYQAGLSIGT
ncbi:MAG TPA: flagellar basal body rod C-terminal domain-containing protein [Acidimicrobiales bacterium]|nr:flagellar basal body rod C-terminal domain-containing protein [Acidimicrobiales bacterium]